MHTEVNGFVYLLEEGTDVYRPVKFKAISQDVFEVLETDDYDPTDETWEFAPGSKVRLVKRRINGLMEYVASALN